MRILPLVALFCLIVVISAKKQHNENLDIMEAESKTHSAKKYTKEHQKSHHHSHKHKKHSPEEELINESEPKAKKAPIEVAEPDIELQENLETSKKAVADEKHKDQLQDLHLQDLTYEENIKKEKKKKGHHGAHRAEVLEKNDEKAEKKLFAEQESKHAVDEKVIEDSFEPLNNHQENGRSKKSKDKKNKEKTKDKSKSKKKAHEKSQKDKSYKKSKDGKKNKDKKSKKDKQY